MAARAITVRIFAAPDASCGRGLTWSGTSTFLALRMRQRFGDSVSVEHVELFSPRSFEFPEILAALKDGAALPIVTVDDRIVSKGGKLSERVIGQAIAGLLPARGKPPEESA